jgi:hypothetical protein
MTKSNKLVGTPPGVINTNNHPNQLRPRENAAVYGPLAIMWNYVQEMRDISSGNMLKNATIVKVIHSPATGAPAGFYECAIRIPELELVDVTQKVPQGVNNKSTAVTNFLRSAEGYLSTTPYIDQECLVWVPETADPSIKGKIVELGDRVGTINASSAKLASSTAASDAVENGDVVLE